MPDPRLTRLADLLVTHSTRLQPGEHVLVETFDVPPDIVVEIIRAARAAGAHPHVAERTMRLMRALNADAGEDQLEVWADGDRHRMAQMDAYIALRGAHNVSELSGIPSEQMQRIARLYQRPVHFEQRINHTRWCVLRWPNPSMAQLAQTDTASFEDFFFDVCTLDYPGMSVAARPLADRMQRADRVRIEGPGETDIAFSIRDIPAVPCTGTHNLPDGECFTAPVRDSINGVIAFNTPTIYQGVSFENVRLVFREGRVVEATADGDHDVLQGILDTDEGARFVGEFAIGFNPFIREPMKDILFDEKIDGSIHLTPGQAYEDADNGNRSEIHWDLVLIQRPERGGGTIHFDDELIRKDGVFVPEELRVLNPEALRG